MRARQVPLITGGPSSITFSLRATNVVVAKCAITSRGAVGRCSNVQSSNVFTCGKRAALIRIRVPFAARDATWRPSTAARYSSWDHPCSRAAPIVHCDHSLTLTERGQHSLGTVSFHAASTTGDFLNSFRRFWFGFGTARPGPARPGRLQLIPSDSPLFRYLF